MAEHFDVAVIGMHASGIIAAGLLAKRGRRVLLLDHGENTTSYRYAGLRLPLVPTLVPALDSSPPIQRVHDELGVYPDLRLATRPLDPVFQLILPRSRIDVHGRRQALLDELRAEFPDLAKALARFFERLFVLDEEIAAFLAKSPPLTPHGLRERLHTRALLTHVAHLDAPFESHDLLAGLGREHPIRDALLGPLAFFGHLASEAPSTLHAVRLIARYYRGALAFHDDVGGLHAFLLKAVERAGVVVRMGASVSNVALQGRELGEVLLDDGHGSFTADYFVDNTVQPFSELLPSGRAQTAYAALEQRVRAVGSLVVLNLIVNRNVIPLGMADTLFLLNGRRTPRAGEPADPPLFLRRYPAWKEEPGPVKTTHAVADASRVVLSTACPVRTRELAHSPERLAALKQQMVARVGRVVPFLSDYLLDSSLAADTASWEVDGSSPSQRIDPWRVHPIFETASRPLLGVAGRTVRTGLKNVVHAGPDVLPGLGLEGEYLTALAVADSLARLAGRRWKLALR